MKWIVVVVLLVIAGFGAFFAFEYFTLSIHGLPSWIPGAKTIPGHPGRPRGHYQKRGALCAVIAFLALIAAGFFAIRNTRSSRKQVATAA